MCPCQRISWLVTHTVSFVREMSSLFQLHAPCIYMWAIRRMRSIQWSMQLSTWVGRYRLFDATYVYSSNITQETSIYYLCAECDSLADGEERHLREDGKECECKDGWGGINCNGKSPRYSEHHCYLTPLQSAKPMTPASISPFAVT